MKFVDFLIPNEHELQSLTGILITDQASLQKAAQRMLDKGVRALLITLGDKGCCYMDSQFTKKYTAHKVVAKDTTAAGDSFIAGFAADYLKHGNVDQAITFAQKVAAITVMRHGAQSSLPTLEEVEQFD